MPLIKQRALSALSNKKFLSVLFGMIAAFLLLNNLVLPWYVNHGEILHVPNVIGQPVDSAKKTLQARGLVPILRHRRGQLWARTLT
jgi:beta-lactam-binding protein with PASTA domain